MTQCHKQFTLFQPHFKRDVEVDFSAETISSDGDALQLRHIEQRLEIIDSFVNCFRDYRDPDRIEFSVKELLSQQLMGLALGYKDLNDHDVLRSDRLLALVVGRSGMTGRDRREEQDRGKPLAGKSTLIRLQLTPPNCSFVQVLRVFDSQKLEPEMNRCREGRTSLKRRESTVRGDQSRAGPDRSASPV